MQLASAEADTAQVLLLSGHATTGVCRLSCLVCCFPAAAAAARRHRDLPFHSICESSPTHLPSNLFSSKSTRVENDWRPVALTQSLRGAHPFAGDLRTSVPCGQRDHAANGGPLRCNSASGTAEAKLFSSLLPFAQSSPQVHQGAHCFVRRKRTRLRAIEPATISPTQSLDSERRLIRGKKHGDSTVLSVKRFYSRWESAGSDVRRESRCRRKGDRDYLH